MSVFVVLGEKLQSGHRLSQIKPCDEGLEIPFSCGSRMTQILVYLQRRIFNKNVSVRLHCRFWSTRKHVCILTILYMHLAQCTRSLRGHFSWPLGPCFRDLRPNWAAHGSGMWVTENSTAENKTCCCNDGGGNTRTYWQEDMIQSPGLFFFLSSPFKQTPDGHPAGMTISLLRFWQPMIPCSFPSLYQKKRQIHNYHSKATKSCVL